MLINTTVGLLSIFGGFVKLSLGWNAFVAITGTAVPIVWYRFLAEGLAYWPYEVIFIWWVIFTMELTAVTTSATWFALTKVKTD